MKFIAFHSEDPRVLQALELDLLTSRQFDWVGRPHNSGWVVAHSGLSPLDRRDNTFFVEGGERLADVGSEELARRARDSSLRTLPGDFTYACFPSQTEACFVRSVAGTAPLFVWHGSSALGVASRLTDLTRYLPEEPRLDHLAIAILIRFAFMPPAGRTPLEAVSLLEYGASLQWSSGRGFRSKRWWYPPRGELPAGARFAEHAVELRSMLLDGLERSLDKAGRNLLTLSGGFDSSALAWAAGDALGREFSTLNLAPRGGPELLEMRSQVDRIFADLGPRVRRRWERELSPEARLEYLRDAPRVVWPVVHPALCVLPAIAAETKLLCMFGGEGCDEQLGGGPALTDWASSASLATAARRFPAAFSRTAAIGYWGRVRARRILHRSGLKSSLAPPSFLAPALRAEYLENARQEQGAFSRDGSERPYLSHRVHHSAAATVQNWEVCSALGLRRYFPFFNRDVLELAYRCDPTELTGQHPKRLVRAAVRGIAPDYLFDVQKLRWHDPPVRLPWTDRLPEELAGIVREDWLEHPPSSLDAQDALRLRALLNIILAVRTCRIEQRESSHVERA